MKRSFALFTGAFVLLLSDAAGAQDYRVRLDARAQSVWFRGLLSDSILADSVVSAANGGVETPDGHAVRCGAGQYCFFFRPGPAVRGVPVSTSASITMWGFGVEGLSLRGSGRLIADLGGDDVWPGTEPSLQLIESLLEYQRPAFIVRGGRQLLSSRLEAIGFDGGWLRYRFNRASIELTGYGGWGLGQAAVVSPLNTVLNPLDEFRPRDRQIVAGAEAAWFYNDVDIRAEYRREVDPGDDHFVSERAALSMRAGVRSLRINGGLDYNIAEGHLGNADLTVAHFRPRYSVSAGARRYRPYFSLWTLWGAFSPVPYTAFNVSGETRLSNRVSLHGRAERYSYEDAGVATGLVPQLEDRGWRASLGAHGTINERLMLDANYGIEKGPGASARSADASMTYTPGEKLSFDVYAGTLARPLELRYYDAESRWLGARAQLQLGGQRRVWADAAAVADDRDRPDASKSSLDQFRLRAGLSLTFGSGADRAPLPPARPTRR